MTKRTISKVKRKRKNLGSKSCFTPPNNAQIECFVRKRPAEKLRAVEKALGVSRSILIEWLLHKQGLVDLGTAHKDSPDIEILESAKNNPNIKTMIKNNLFKRCMEIKMKKMYGEYYE